MGDTLIEVKGLTVKSGRHYLLDKIDWKVQKGEQWIVFGMNGSGKTTLLSAIAGFRHYSSGSISLFGQPLTAENVLEMRRRIGWVSGSFFDNCYSNESTLEIIMAGKTGTLGLDFSIGHQDSKRVKEWLRRFHLEDKCNMPFYTLSKGERQNVLLIRALMNEPEILVLDEPCSGLDIDARERVLRMVGHLTRETGTTVVYVSHYAEELMRDVFTNALLLKRGRSYAQGAMGECFNNKTLAGFLGYPVTVDYDASNRMQIRIDAARDDEWGQIL